MTNKYIMVSQMACIFNCLCNKYKMVMHKICQININCTDLQQKQQMITTTKIARTPPTDDPAIIAIPWSLTSPAATKIENNEKI